MNARFCSSSLALLHVLALPACALGLLFASPARAEDKSFVSEIADNKVGVQIVVSGPRTETIGKAIQSAIIANSRQKRPNAPAPQGKGTGNVVIVPLATYQSAPAVSTTQIFLLMGDECGATFPSALKTALPVDVDAPDTTLSVLQSRITSDAKNAGAFSIVFFAPDAARFAPLYEDFSARHFGANFRDMGKVSRRIRTNRVALFSNPEMRPDIAPWGRLASQFDRAPLKTGPCQTNEVTDDIQWFDLDDRAKLTEERLNETAEVYFFDRSNDGPMPPQVTKALTGVTLAPTALLTWRGTTPTGRPLVVFSAPTALLLNERAVVKHDLKALAEGVQLDQAIDMHRMSRTTLLVNGNVARDERDALRVMLAKDMREELDVVIEERGGDFFATLDSEDALRQFQGDAHTRDQGRTAARSDWVWMFTVLEYSGETTYDHAEERITPVPAAFSESEPTEPSEYESTGFFKQRRKDRKQYDREMDEYRDKHREWEKRRRRYDERANTADYQWHRVVNAHERANVRGVLRLVNLRDGGRVEWETECRASANDDSQLRSDTISLPGRDARPSSLDAPDTRHSCALELMHHAAREAGGRAIDTLRAQVWLPDASDDEDETDATIEAPAPTLPVNTPRVAAILGDTLVLTIGAAQGVRVGDVFSVALAFVPITEPDTGQVLDTKVTQKLLVRVTGGGDKTAECVALTPADTAKWAKLKPGQPVTKRAEPQGGTPKK